MKRILFQGDSITDAQRSREEDWKMGNGYPTLVSAHLGCEYPGEYEFINRGIGGNRIVDLYARMKSDIVNLKPDIMSILIGVNGVWQEITRGNGVPAKKYELIYNMLINEVKEFLPDIKIMTMGPYVLKGSATEENWDTFRSEVDKRIAAAKNVAQKNGLIYIPLQEKFDEGLKKAPANYWTMDGVHPTAMGHEIIKRAWLDGFSRL